MAGLDRGTAPAPGNRTHPGKNRRAQRRMGGAHRRAGLARCRVSRRPSPDPGEPSPNPPRSGWQIVWPAEFSFRTPVRSGRGPARLAASARPDRRSYLEGALPHPARVTRAAPALPSVRAPARAPAAGATRPTLHAPAPPGPPCRFACVAGPPETQTTKGPCNPADVASSSRAVRGWMEPAGSVRLRKVDRVALEHG